MTNRACCIDIPLRKNGCLENPFFGEMTSQLWITNFYHSSFGDTIQSSAWTMESNIVIGRWNRRILLGNFKFTMFGISYVGKHQIISEWTKLSTQLPKIHKSTPQTKWQKFQNLFTQRIFSILNNKSKVECVKVAKVQLSKYFSRQIWLIRTWLSLYTACQLAVH